MYVGKFAGRKSSGFRHRVWESCSGGQETKMLVCRLLAILPSKPGQNRTEQNKCVGVDESDYIRGIQIDSRVAGSTAAEVGFSVVNCGCVQNSCWVLGVGCWMKE